MKVSRGTLDRFEGVVTIANRETTLETVCSWSREERPTFAARPDWDFPELAATQYEPMEVDHAQMQACYVCLRMGNVAKNHLKRMSSIPAAREVMCHFCREMGHVKCNCPKRQKHQHQRSN